MAIMITGASIMDGALLMVLPMNHAHNLKRGASHGIEIAGIENVVIVQNKIDIVTKKEP